MGQNSHTFEALTGPLRSALPSDWMYTFADANTECQPAPGVQEIFPGPYLCHGQTYDTECIKAQHKYMQGILDDQGPFDGVLAFSQGAAIISSVILHRQRDEPLEPPLFRFAVFCSGTLPFSKDISVGWDVTSYFEKSSVDATLHSLTNGSGWGGIDESLAGRGRVCRQFTPDSRYERIDMPTVHVYDAQETSTYLKEQHPALVELSRADSRLVYKHGSGHKMPSGGADNREIAHAITAAVELSKVQI